MNICEVYAVNIMPEDIASFIGCFPKDKEQIEECRQEFLQFLLDRQTQGVLYYSQLTAWSQYKEWTLTYNKLDEQFEYLDKSEEEIEDLSWDDELKLLAYMKANTIEFLGNYDYSSQGLPSQQ